MPTVIPLFHRQAAPAAVAMSDQVTPRVFTPSFQERLALLNAAERELRSMGFHIVWSRLAGQVPHAHIHREATVSVSPLLDRMGPRSFRTEHGCTVVSGEFMGITLSWAEPN